MIIRDDGEVELACKDDLEVMSKIDDCNDVEYDVQRESLVIRRYQSVQIYKDDVEQQKKNLFHTRCYIDYNIYSMIIDNSSCTNIASSTLVRKLNLNTFKHAKPYKLQFLNEYGEVRVTKKLLVSFTIRKSKDEVVYDVVFMHATLLLLGGPQQFDRKAKHDGFKNKYTVVKDGNIYTLALLSPRKMYEDQLKLKKAKEAE